MFENWITPTAAELSGYHPEYLRHLLQLGKIKAQKFAIVWQIDRISFGHHLNSTNRSPARTSTARHGALPRWLVCAGGHPAGRCATVAMEPPLAFGAQEKRDYSWECCGARRREEECHRIGQRINE